MSAFDDFNAYGWDEAVDVFGASPSVIDGVPYPGILDENEASISINDDGGGWNGNYSATLVIKASLMASLPDPLEKHLQDKEVTVQGRKYKVARAVVDSLTATLYLINPFKR